MENIKKQYASELSDVKICQVDTSVIEKDQKTEGVYLLELFTLVIYLSYWLDEVIFTSIRPGTCKWSLAMPITYIFTFAPLNVVKSNWHEVDEQFKYKNLCHVL